MYRALLGSLALAMVAGAGCSRGEASSSSASSSSASSSSPSSNTTAAAAKPLDAAAPASAAIGASAASAAAADSAGSAARETRAPNKLGRIPVLEYHIIGDSAALFTRTREQFRADLSDVYRRGYRPITISQLLDRDFSGVPAGMSPVVVVFDDASPDQFSYVEQNGRLAIDPASGMGIWLDFARRNPGWNNRAVFCMLNGGAAGHNFFGDKPKFRGQKNEWRFQKVKWLADNGFELCDHTLWHAKLNKYPDAVVQEQIARNAMGIDSAVPGYRIRTMALPYGLWPKNRSLAWQGAWTDPKTGKVHPYKFDAVLEVTGGPTRSPYDPQFNPRNITRVIATGDDVRRALDQLDRTNNRFVVGP